MEKRYVISMLVHDQPGVLAKIAGMFYRRNFNIDTITVGKSERVGHSRMVISFKGDKRHFEQLIKQDAFITHEGGNLTILKNTVPNSFVQLITETGNVDYDFERSSPEKINIKITDRFPDVKIFVREAYYIGWIATVDNDSTSVMSTPEGFILITPEPSPAQVTLEYTRSNNPYIWLSLLMIGLIILLLTYSRKKSTSNLMEII